MCLAGEVRATLVAGGIKVALLSSALGTLILAVASLLWFGLQLRWRFLIAEQLLLAWPMPTAPHRARANPYRENRYVTLTISCRSRKDANSLYRPNSS